jgi:chromosome segregation ATPase
LSVELFFQIAGLLGAFVTALWALVKVIARQQENSLEERFKGLKESIGEVSKSVADEQDATRRLERELLQLRAELPRDYVRREDFTRVIASFEVKVDNLRLTIERLLFKQTGS